MRTAFIKQLVEEARTNDKIFLIVGDLGYNVVEPFAQAYPQRFLNAGISEQNMAGMAAGLAMSGYNVYLYSIGNFPTLRCLEQTRNDITYYNGSVKIVSVGAGFAYGSQGMSHHATEDIGVMRALPNMVVCSPSDPSETRKITHLSANYSGSMYIRLGKAGEKEIFTDGPCTLKLGDLHCYQESNAPCVLLTTGSITAAAVDWVKGHHVDTALYSVPFIKPIDGEQLCQLAHKHSNWIVLDEHQKSCGVASALIEQLSDLYQEGAIEAFPKIRRLEVNDEYIHVAGDQAYLRQITGLQLSEAYFK